MHLKSFLLLYCQHSKHTIEHKPQFKCIQSKYFIKGGMSLLNSLSSFFPAFVFPCPNLCLTFSPSCRPLLFFFSSFPFHRPLFRDHSKILVGDGRGRVFSWSVSDQPGRSAADHWVKDEVVDSCSGCTVRFSLTERRHHCRNCGQLFCQK